MRRLFEGGVYSRAAFIRGNTVIIVLSIIAAMKNCADRGLALSFFFG